MSDNQEQADPGKSITHSSTACTLAFIDGKLLFPNQCKDDEMQSPKGGGFILLEKGRPYRLMT